MTPDYFDESQEQEPGIEEELELAAELFYENPTDKELFENYVYALKWAANNEMKNLITKEYEILLGDSDLPNDPNMENIFNQLKDIFEELINQNNPDLSL